MSHGGFINPINMKPVEWTAAMQIELDRFGILPAINKDEDWRLWGRTALLLPSIDGIVLPNPDEFQDFQSWAKRFVEIMASKS